MREQRERRKPRMINLNLPLSNSHNRVSEPEMKALVSNMGMQKLTFTYSLGKTVSLCLRKS